MSEQRGQVKVERGSKRVRAYLGGELVADTTSPLLVSEVPYVRVELLEEGAAAVHSPSRGDADPDLARQADRSYRSGLAARPVKKGE